MSTPSSPSTPTPPEEPPAPPPPPDAFARAFLTHDPDAGELVLVRHGQQDYPVDRRAARDAWVDPPLSAVGIRQADAVGRALAHRPVAAVYSSGLQRAKETGDQIARHHGLEVTVLDAVREIEMFRDLPDGVDLMDAVDPLLLQGARERFVLERRWDVWPYTETGEEFRHRVLMATEGILVTHPGQRVVVACHGGVINTIAAAVLGIGEDMFFRPGHASVHRIGVLGARRVIWSLNETHHLAAAGDDLVTY